MFKPVPMMRIRVILLQEDEQTVLRSLGQLGVLHLTRTVAGPDTAPLQPHDGKLEIERCDDLLERLTKMAEAARSTLPHLIATEPGGTGPPLSPDLTLDAIDESLRQMEEKFAGLLAKRQSLLSRKQELDSLCDRVSDYRELDIPLDHLDRFSFLHFIVGSVPQSGLDTLSRTPDCTAVPLPSPPRGGRQAILVMTTPSNRQLTEDRLRTLDFHHADLPAVDGLTARSFLESHDGQRSHLEQELNQVTDSMHAFAAESAGYIAALKERVVEERRLAEARQYYPRTESAFLLAGWIPADRAPALEEHLATITRGRCVIAISRPRAADGPEVPVSLQHTGWLRPFQKMVTAYGLPTYQEVEPTFFVAISYVLLFGMMFGDAGQGAILALAGWVALRLRRFTAYRDLGRILMLVGLSSVGFGIIYGSYFGIPELKEYALWRDPLEGDPLALMLAAVGLGVIVISIGLVLNILNRFRCGEMTEGWLGRYGVMGVLFYWGTLALLVKSDLFRSHGLLGTAITLLLIMPLLGWMIKEPVQALWRRRRGESAEPGGAAVMVAESLIGTLEGITGYLANTTSFVRLAAYAMSHAALLMAVFMVAGQLQQSVPLGGVWGLLVIIAGNGVAIILEGIIAAVQALRLEYYEFFGKFLAGNGRPYTPFCLHQP